MILATEEDVMERLEERQYMQDGAVGTSEGDFWNLKFISPTTIIVTYIHLTIHLSLVPHVMD